MRISPLVAAAAATALLASLAGPASAATEPAPAAGVASSAVTLLDVAAGGRTVTAGTLSLLSDALGTDAVAKIVVTPLTVDGLAYGERTITPADSPATVTAFDSGTVAPALAGLVKVTSPVFTGTAQNGSSGASSRVGADSLGGVAVLGLPIALEGTLDVGSLVSRTGGAVGDKTLEITNLALPSIADLLAALGLDLSKLPTEVLVELLTELDILTTAVTTAGQALTDAIAAAGIQPQIDAAQAEVDTATTALAAKVDELAGTNSELAAAQDDLAATTAALAPPTAAVATAQRELATANAALATATGALNAALDVAGLSGIDAYNELLPVFRDPLASVIDPLIAAVTAAQGTVASATATVATATSDLAAAQSLADIAAAAVTALESAIATLQGVIDTLQEAVDAAVGIVTNVLTSVQPLIASLLAAVTAVLDGTPLVSIDALTVITESKVTSANDGGQSATVVGGEITGLHVLGTDVLNNVLGATRLDLLDLTGSTLDGVNGLLTELTGTLSSVLSTVPGFPLLKIPAPTIELLTKQSGTGIADGFGTASTGVRALSVTLPSITLPQALALPSAANLPVFASTLEAFQVSAVLDSAGNFVSSPVTVALGILSEQARFRPAGSVPPTVAPGAVLPTTGSQLPRTGTTGALALLGVVLMGAAVVARRRRSPLEDAVG